MFAKDKTPVQKPQEMDIIKDVSTYWHTSVDKFRSSIYQAPGKTRVTSTCFMSLFLPLQNFEPRALDPGKQKFIYDVVAARSVCVLP